MKNQFRDYGARQKPRPKQTKPDANASVEEKALAKIDERYIRTGYWEPVRENDWDEY